MESVKIPLKQARGMFGCLVDRIVVVPRQDGQRVFWRIFKEVPPVFYAFLCNRYGGVVHRDTTKEFREEETVEFWVVA